MTIVLNLLPIFLLLGLGFVGSRRGFFPPGFVEPANRLAFWLAIPALIFKAVATAKLEESWQPLPALMAVVALIVVWLLALLLSRLLYAGSPGQGPTRASWVHCAVHGNQAFLGLAVVYYALGQAGLNALGLVAAVVIIAQNLLGVLTLTRFSGPPGQGGSAYRALLMNPITLSSAAGLAWSLAGLKMPEVMERTLGMLGGLGLPLALLIVGATLSQGRLGRQPLGLAMVSLFKLVLLPGLGLLLMSWWRPVDLPVIVAVILLASPSATITVIMANQMGGDPKLSSEAATLTHALSILTYPLWLWCLTG